MTDSSSGTSWNQLYARIDVMGDHAEQRACAVLVNHQYLLPGGGKALDLACGLGYNSLLLAKLGFQVDAWDDAEAAIDKLQRSAERLGLNTHLKAQVRDVIAKPPKPNSYDIITVSHFLHRPLCPALSAALKPEGLLFYQTFHANKAPNTGPKNPDFILQNNELISLFSGLSVLFYQEYGQQGQPTQGDRNTAQLIAQKR